MQRIVKLNQTLANQTLQVYLCFTNILLNRNIHFTQIQEEHIRTKKRFPLVAFNDTILY